MRSPILRLLLLLLLNQTVASLRDLAMRMFGGGQPQAYSRITRTPIYIRDSLSQGGQELAGLYHPDDKTIEVSRQYAQPGRSTIGHESAHAIWDASNMKGMGGVVSQDVPPAQQSTMSYYKYSDSPETRADEGLGFSIGDPSATGYVNSVANKITDPNLKQQLLRLHQNRLGVGQLYK